MPQRLFRDHPDLPDDHRSRPDQVGHRDHRGHRRRGIHRDHPDHDRLDHRHHRDGHRDHPDRRDGHRDHPDRQDDHRDHPDHDHPDHSDAPGGGAWFPGSASGRPALQARGDPCRCRLRH